MTEDSGVAVVTPTPPVPTESVARACRIASFFLAGAVLLLVLFLHLLPALLAGLLVYELVEIAAPRLRIARIRGRQAKLVAIGLLALGVVGLLAGLIAGIVAFVHSESGSLPILLQKMADVIESWRTRLPSSIVDLLPEDVDEVRGALVPWLREHAGTLQHAGTAGGRVAAHLLLGAVVGALAALHDARSSGPIGPLAYALQERAARLGLAFRRVVFGQVRISAINTLLTGLYLVVALRIAGVHLPLAKTMIALTFLVGLLPVVGNLISNTAILVLSLSVSPAVAIASLVYLVVIHKFEYFLNAHIVGTQVRAHAWELLLAMLVMEAAFGVPGLIAAPIYYAYVKDELVQQELV
jgi:predicted PurR-regulated permease PerM